jgi:1-acyl-sn-glycerol-3-phosphate acyltransferase
MKKYHTIIPWILQKIGYILAWIVLKFFVHLEIRGKENLQDITKPLILAQNHTGELDSAIFALIWPLFSKQFPVYFVSNPKEKFHTFGWRSYIYGGAFFNMLGAYPIISGHHNYAYALQNHIFLLRKGKTVCIFPEGGRTRDGKLKPSHGGVAYLAYTTSTSVLPIATNTFYNLNWKEFFLRRRHIVVTIGKPMSYKEVVPSKTPYVADFQAGGQRVMEAIGKML